MRNWFFKKLLHNLESHTPEILRHIQLQLLMNLTARAFQVPGKKIWCCPSDQALEAYARFTVACMEQTPANPERLYRLSYALGNKLRRLTGLKQPGDRQRLVFWLYRNIGIRMSGSLPGEIRVTECCFSRFYTPEQCRRIEAMDAGIITGICGGESLHFTRRITEGCDQCTACLRKEKQDE